MINLVNHRIWNYRKYISGYVYEGIFQKDFTEGRQIILRHYHAMGSSPILNRKEE